MKITHADEQVVVGSSGDVQCILSTSFCELHRADQLADELIATLPEGFSRWSIRHLASIMLEDSAWPEEFVPSVIAMGWGRAWRQGDLRITRISGFLIGGPVGADSWGRSLVVCTRQGAIARSLVHPAVAAARYGEGLRMNRREDRDDRPRPITQCFVPHASHLASAVDAALDPIMSLGA